MAKEFFKDLPNTTTPLTATRLNGLLDGDEALGNLVVESIQSKNMFDKNINFQGFIDTSSNKIVYDSPPQDRYSGIVKIKPNTTYTISKRAGNSFRIATTTLYPNSGVSYNYTTANHTGTSITLTTGSNDNYLVIFYYGASNGDTGGYQSMASTVQVEIGTVVTTYVPYQNLNGNNNYTFTEQVIGTWVDGKSLYRSIFTISNPQSSNTDYADLTNLNIYRVVNLYGYYLTTTGTFDIPFYDSATNYCVMFYSPTNKLRGRFGTPNIIAEAKVVIEYTKN